MIAPEAAQGIEVTAEAGLRWRRGRAIGPAVFT